MANSSSTATHGKHPAGLVCTYEDWQDIKELFAKAAEQYNGEYVPRVSQFVLSPHSDTNALHPPKYSPGDGRS